MDGAGLIQWLAIGLSFVAVIAILRYARQPRCELCSRRHARPDLTTQPPEARLLAVELPEAADFGAISWKAEYQHAGADVDPRRDEDGAGH